jgi:excisionase family DNA binding protein
VSDEPDASDLVRIGELSERLGIPTWTLRRLADAARIPSVRSAGGHRSFDTTAVRAALSRTEDGRFGAAPVEPSGDPTWTALRSLREPLEEHLVWRELTDAVMIDEATPAGTVLRYSFTEMLNNAIDHSGGTTVNIAVWVTPDTMAFRIADDGDGAFAHLRHGLGLADDFEAISSLTKGKQTTWPERHTGEGIFFTSKVNDLFQLSANGKRWTVDNIREDQAVGVSPVERGTVAYAQVEPQTTRSTRDVFEAFTKDYEFERTRPLVKLFGMGVRFVSRSEARRLLADLDDFTELDIDFAGVQDVGQGFVDELLRVWPQEHPATTINPINMNAAVEFMVRRGLAR